MTRLQYKFLLKIRLLILLLSIFVLIQCKFDKILQPKSAKPGDVIEILLTISDNNVPEPNPHKGLLCILIPEDWSFVSGNYSGTVGSGNLELSNEWADSAESCYPANGFAGGMKWIALLSDSGYAYASPITIGVSVKLKVGETEGCYDLAYLVTKATRDLLCTSWTPLSYPHRIGIPDSCAIEQELKGESAPEWDDLFYRNSGWTGGRRNLYHSVKWIRISTGSIQRLHTYDIWRYLYWRGRRKRKAPEFKVNQ